MKLPLASTVFGLLFGIGAVIFIEPQTKEGAAFILFVAVLVATAIGLAAGKLRGLTTKAPGKGPQGPQR